jgi:large subunit ribosomal protein L30
MDSQQPSTPPSEQPKKLLRITLVRSPLGNTLRHKKTVLALGLRRIRQTVEHPDSPSVRGMLAKVAHMVKVEEVA